MLPKCPTCGYSTVGLTSPACPECGTTIPLTAPPSVPEVGRRVLLALGLVISTIGLGYVTAYLPGVPRLWGVLPLTVIIPLFRSWELSHEWYRWLAFVPLTVVSVVITIPILLGCRRIRWWSLSPFIGLQCLAWWWFAAGSRYGFEYHSITYVAFCGSVQLLFTLTFLRVVMWNRRRQTFASAAAFHGLTSLWLASYAFPYYGELP